MTLSAQENQTILTIGDQAFSSGEFWHVYNKNKHLPGFNESPEDFAERFINYKLKVVEAMDQGLDTMESFINEYEKYANDLKKAFMVDSSAIELVARQAITICSMWLRPAMFW
ncbi:PpiC-type PPIASE domain Rotamase [Geofilum rubicundum JCM 15548]|uniref:PpiC-type PPIASE domain Rotamase n=2 Tax=Geofilum TaxID=1236988 RepID=A0A0E9M257_9BACT|nr:PpiC-type PPIASE domain Rotamase [Geofilum rubicundum JCM 15548]